MFVWKLGQAHGRGITAGEAIGCIKGQGLFSEVFAGPPWVMPSETQDSFLVTW